jgi:hypothetical protein
VNASGEWKKWEIDGLGELQIPFFVGTIDKATHRIRLYSTSAKWFLLHTRAPIGKLELCVDDPRNPLAHYQTADIETKEGRLPSFEVPLGAPILEVSVEEIGTEKFDAASRALESAISVEYRNLVYNKIGTPHALCPKDNRKANEPLDGYYYSFANRPDKLAEQLDWMRPVCISVAGNYKNEGRTADLNKLRPIFDLLPLSEEDRKILRQIYGDELF